ncbi:MAG: hypothetical protein HY942_00350 [Gammaproteobacteria bacterium]|nr:hypothetical protein [Gammaproteobacteria bacterium]
MAKKKPKKPKQHKPKKLKPKKPKKPKQPLKPHRPGKPDPDKPRRKRGKKPQKPLKKRPRGPRSGSIPRACRTLIGSPNLLDCWLEHNPKVADAIIWQPAPDVSNASQLAWPDWTNAMKAELRQAWMDARTWHANGMTNFTGTFIEDPPPNQDFALEGAPFFRTVFDAQTQAWPLYLAIVAHSLATEIDAWVPWSLRGYSPEALEHILSGALMFRRDTNDGGAWDSDHPGGYVLGGAMSLEKVTPSHPTFTYPFLTQNSLVGSTALATIAHVLDWCRWNLSHYLGSFTPQNAENHWQYRGAAPVRRIIEGTPLLNPQNPGVIPAPKHWTPGCWGTSGFLRSLLRAVNIPVTLKFRCGHTLPYFIGAGRYLSHGDDPYNALARANYPAELLLLDEATFNSWFPFDPNDPQNPANQATACQHVGRRVIDLAVWHIGDALLFYYCQDKANGLDHASGQVYALFSPHGYSVTDLEATNLWQRLAAEAQLQGKC